MEFGSGPSFVISSNSGVSKLSAPLTPSSLRSRPAPLLEHFIGYATGQVNYGIWSQVSEIYKFYFQHRALDSRPYCHPLARPVSQCESVTASLQGRRQYIGNWKQKTILVTSGSYRSRQNSSSGNFEACSCSSNVRTVTRQRVRNAQCPRI